MFDIVIPDIVHLLTHTLLHQSNRSYSKGGKSDTQSTYTLPFGKSKKGWKKSGSASNNSGEEDFSTVTKSKSAKVVLHLFVRCPFLSMYFLVAHLYLTTCYLYTNESQSRRRNHL